METTVEEAFAASSSELSSSIISREIPLGSRNFEEGLVAAFDALLLPTFD